MTSIMFFLFFIPLLAFILLNLNFFLAPHKPYKEKKTPFECGYHSFTTQNRTPFTISFYIFAMLFLLFDIEITTVFPFVVSSNFNGTYGFFIVISFILFLTLGFLFELGKNALKIDTKQDLSYLVSKINWSLLFSIVRNKFTIINFKHYLIVALSVTLTIVLLKYFIFIQFEDYFNIYKIILNLILISIGAILSFIMHSNLKLKNNFSFKTYLKVVALAILFYLFIGFISLYLPDPLSAGADLAQSILGISVPATLGGVSYGGFTSTPFKLPNIFPMQSSSSSSAPGSSKNDLGLNSDNPLGLSAGLSEPDELFQELKNSVVKFGRAVTHASQVAGDLEGKSDSYKSRANSISSVLLPELHKRLNKHQNFEDGNLHNYDVGLVKLDELKYQGHPDYPQKLELMKSRMRNDIFLIKEEIKDVNNQIKGLKELDSLIRYR